MAFPGMSQSSSPPSGDIPEHWRRRRSCRAPCGLGLAFPVVDGLAVTGREDVVVLRVLGDDLLAVRVLHDLRGDPRRKHQDTDRLLGRVSYLVRAGAAPYEACDVPFTQLALPLWCSQCRTAAKDEQP